MSERSQFWTTGTTGDGTTTISEAQTTEWFGDILTPFGSSGPNTSQGVLAGLLGELAVTGAATPVSVAAGGAVVEGYYYKSTAAVTVAIPTPAVATRIDVIVLRASHSTTRTVRITRIAGVEAGGVPALTQVAGTTWDIPLANVSITTGGDITLTDRRTFCYFGTKVATAMLDADAVTDPKLRNSAALSVIGRAANSVGDPGDIAAGSNEQVLMRTGNALVWQQIAQAQLGTGSVGSAQIIDGSVATGDLADNAVTDGKLRDSIALSVIGRSANSTGDPADIQAGSDGYVLRRSASGLGFGPLIAASFPAGIVDTTILANDSVDDTKLGLRAPQLRTRKGGDATAWSTPGTTDYTIGTAVHIQCGAHSVGWGAVSPGSTIDVSITFPQAFSAAPNMFFTGWWSAGPIIYALNLGVVSASGFTVRFSVITGSGTGTVRFDWLALGPE